LAFGLSRAEARARVGERARRVYARGLLVALAAGIVALFAVVGAPPTLARKAWDSFKAPPVSVTSLNQRLLSFSGSGRVDAWRLALDDFGQHPVTGSGAGSYEAFWNRHRPSISDVRDAHNLYLETMAELGSVGLVLLLVVLATPLAVVRRAARHPLGPAAAGAYVVYLVHAGVDWDWEVPAVTVAGLLAGLTLLVMARGTRGRSELTLRARVAILAAVVSCAAFALVGLVGHTATAASAKALREGRLQEAEVRARDAARWEPWSPRPWQLIADARYQQGDVGAAVRYYRLALRRDPQNWQLWSDLGFALGGTGRAADAAFAQARLLNPRNAQTPAPGS
jgi:O-antigen ligase